jgi:hypothetical protein
MSENLTRLAQRIDFVGKEDEIGRGVGGRAASAAGEPSKDEAGIGNDEQTFKTTPAWPWESARNKLQ